MATIEDISDAVEQVLAYGAARTAIQLNSATRERAFEAYVFSLVVRAVRQAGGIVTIRGVITGDNPDPIIFRGGPGNMSSSSQNFAYADCEVNNRSFEVHVDVQYVGTSRAVHEVDVSIYDHDRAEIVRGSNIIPNTRNLRAALECKFYDSTLGVSLGRTFIGLLSDLGGLTIKGFATNGRNLGLAKYFSKSDRPQPFFALSPLRTDVAERFVSSLEQDLRKWCCVY